MKIIKKLFCVIVIVMVVQTVFMLLGDGKVWADGGWFSGAMNSIEANAENGGTAGEKVSSLMGAIINIMSTIGAGVAIIMLIVIGIQYVSKGAEGKAEAKKDLTGYVVGAVILFGVSGILKILQMFIDANFNNAA